MSISILVPAYNEENRIASCLAKVKAWGSEVVVVTDGTDGTWKIAQKLGASVFRFDHRLGKGGAILEGLKHVYGDYVLIVDADVPVDDTWFEVLKDKLAYYDVVIASRYKSDSMVSGMPLKRRLLSFGYRKVCGFLFCLPINDYQCGVKAFKRSVLNSIRSSIKSNGYCFDTEVLVQLFNRGHSICEVGVDWRYDSNSKVGLKDAWKMLIEVWKIWKRTKDSTIG